MVHRDLAPGGIGGDHLAAQMIDLVVLSSAGLRGRLLAGVAAGQHDKSEQGGSKQSTHHRVSLQPPAVGPAAFGMKN
jgi:hypothetical protein